MNNPFLYEITMKNSFVLGVLLTINGKGVLAKKIRKHEQIDSIKANNFHRDFSNNTPQSTPIILGVFSREFDRLLDRLKINTNAVNVTKNEKIWLISQQCKITILDILHAEPELFLVDGHHRLNALQTLGKPIVAWVVLLDKLSIKSFIKVYRCKNIDRLLSKCNLYKSEVFDSHTQAKQITIFVNKCIYQLLIPNF